MRAEQLWPRDMPLRELPRHIGTVWSGRRRFQQDYRKFCPRLWDERGAVVCVASDYTIDEKYDNLCGESDAGAQLLVAVLIPANVEDSFVAAERRDWEPVPATEVWGHPLFPRADEKDFGFGAVKAVQRCLWWAGMQDHGYTVQAFGGLAHRVLNEGSRF